MLLPNMLVSTCKLGGMQRGIKAWRKKISYLKFSFVLFCLNSPASPQPTIAASPQPTSPASPQFNLNQMKCCESPSNYFITTTTTSKLSYQNIYPNNSTSSHRQSSCTAVHSTPQHIFSAVSSRQNSNHICRSTSKCKNLILGN